MIDEILPQLQVGPHLFKTETTVGALALSEDSFVRDAVSSCINQIQWVHCAHRSLLSGEVRHALISLSVVIPVSLPDPSSSDSDDDIFWDTPINQLRQLRQSKQPKATHLQEAAVLRNSALHAALHKALQRRHNVTKRRMETLRDAAQSGETISPQQYATVDSLLLSCFLTPL